jgi:apolipoprotein D and lipocalin family protein
MKTLSLFTILLFSNLACSSVPYTKTVEELDFERFMGKWYVLAARGTGPEAEAYNSVEVYTWNEEKERIDIDFTYLDKGFEGKKKSIPQKGWIENETTKAHWKVSPFWPLKFDYLIIDIDQDYEWVIIGVPNQKWVWIMARNWKVSKAKLDSLILRVKKLGYRHDDIRVVPQQW